MLVHRPLSFLIRCAIGVMVGGGNRVLSFQSHMNPIKNWSVRKAHVIETCVAFHNIRGGEFLLKERGKWILRREEWRRSYVNLGSS